MKKSMWIVVIIVAIVVIGGGAWWFMKDRDNNNGSSSSSTSQNGVFTAVQACELFTLEDAQQVLGSTAEVGVNNADTSSGEVNVSTCNYTNAATTPADIQVATVLVRSPESQAGADSNQDYFDNQQPADAQAVGGYGDMAFWDPAMGQLNVLKDGTWTIIQFGSISPQNNTLEQAQQLADIIVPKL